MLFFFDFVFGLFCPVCVVGLVRALEVKFIRDKLRQSQLESWTTKYTISSSVDVYMGQGSQDYERAGFHLFCNIRFQLSWVS